MAELSELERKILATLITHPFELDACRFANAVTTPPRNSIDELQAVGCALIALLNGGYIETAHYMIPGAADWWRLGTTEPLALLQDLKICMEWSPSQHCWEWSSGKYPLKILLTDEGFETARRIICA